MAKGKPGFEEFAKQRAPARYRSLMAAKNHVVAPVGFERTVAERIMPMLGGDIASGQSLKDGLNGVKSRPPIARFFGRSKGYGKGGDA